MYEECASRLYYLTDQLTIICRLLRRASHAPSPGWHASLVIVTIITVIIIVLIIVVVVVVILVLSLAYQECCHLHTRNKETGRAGKPLVNRGLHTLYITAHTSHCLFGLHSPEATLVA